MRVRLLTIEQILTILAETPPRIVALTASLAPAQLHSAPNPDEWSASDVLAHLRACNDVWGNNMLVIIAEDRPLARTVLYYADGLACHERTHVKQIERIVNTMRM